MHTFQTTQNHLRHVYILDVLGIARAVEAALADYNLLPPQPRAWYLPNKAQPVLETGKVYWYEVVEQIATGPMNPHLPNVPPQYRYNYSMVRALDEVAKQPWDVVDQPDGTGRLVVSHREFHLLSDQPYLPSSGLKLVYEAVVDEVYGTRAFENALRVRTIEELVAPISVFNGQSATLLRGNPQLTDMFTYLFDLLNPMRAEIREFLHGQQYAICDIEQHNAYTFQINIKGDHRILEWEQHKASGKW